MPDNGFCCSQINWRNRARGHGTGYSLSGVEKHPKEKTKQAYRGTSIGDIVYLPFEPSMQ